MSDEAGLVFAYLLDGSGGGGRLSPDGMRAWTRPEGLIWIHLDYSHPESRRWIREDSGLDEIVQEALLAEETRPRIATLGSGLLMLLRGVNLNPGADPEDMVSIRMWLEPDRIITTRRRKLLSVQDLRECIEGGTGPGNTAEFLVDISDRVVSRMSTVIEEIYDRVDELEDAILESQTHEMRSTLASLRRQIISLRRYLAPQREAMARLQMERVPWMGELDRIRLREVADRITRYVEDLDETRDRAGVTHEELTSRLSEQMNQRMYVLSVVAAIFLPLGFFTGLLGINVGGIPGAENPAGFRVFLVLLAGVVAFQLWWFKRRRWF